MWRQFAALPAVDLPEAKTSRQTYWRTRSRTLGAAVATVSPTEVALWTVDVSPRVAGPRAPARAVETKCCSVVVQRPTVLSLVVTPLWCPAEFSALSPLTQTQMQQSPQQTQTQPDFGAAPGVCAWRRRFCCAGYPEKTPRPGAGACSAAGASRRAPRPPLQTSAGLHLSRRRESRLGCSRSCAKSAAGL